MGFLQTLILGSVLQASALTVTVTPTGPTNSEIRELENFALSQLRQSLRARDHKLFILNTEVIYENKPGDEFKIHAFDHKNSRMFKVSGPVNRSQKPKIEEVLENLEAANSEYDEAV